ncbi:hypothetical protein C7S17_6370 [Burkholderia thailandensis]|nr:hypothetical protein [Burkholderia thailandensis]
MRRASRLRDDATRERGSRRRRASSDSECDGFSGSGESAEADAMLRRGRDEEVQRVDVPREQPAACGLRLAACGLRLAACGLRLAACGRLCQSACCASKSSRVLPSDREGRQRLPRSLPARSTDRDAHVALRPKACR